MKKIIRNISFASLMMMATMPGMAASAPASAGSGGDALCALIMKMMGVFKILRTLAFVGAAFYIAGWAWSYISKGEAKMDDIQKKGIGLLVGFTLLFGIGVVLSFLMSQGGMNMIGCSAQLASWGAGNF